MNRVDLRQFQFDYDLTWAALCLHPDGTVYARYGSRTAADAMATNSLAGLKATLRRALEAHAGYPANRRLFAEKRGPEPPLRTPEGRSAGEPPRGRGAFNSASCIHCHNVHERLDTLERQRGASLAERAFKYPLPESLGLVLDTETGSRILGLLPDSPAARAGLASGDEVVSLNGQAIFSLADVQFVLHHLRGETDVAARLRRREAGGEAVIEKTLSLAGAWRRTDFSWRASLRGMSPAEGLYVYKLEPEAKAKLGIDPGHVALEVRGVFAPLWRGSGLEEGDVIIAYDGKKESLGAPGFNDYLRVHHLEPGSVLKLDVLRHGDVRSVEVKL